MNLKGYKLFVDDMREIPPGWIGARTVSEAIAVLAHLKVDELSLDHDIVHPSRINDGYLALSQETFKGVAHYLAVLPRDKWPNRIRIHSSNAGAAQTMCDILGLNFEDTYKHYTPKDY